MAHKDDETIRSDERLLRRIHPTQVIPDENLGRRRPTSAAFHDFELSVEIASSLEARSLPLTHSLAGHPGFFLASITAKIARDHAQLVCRDPIPGNASHALIVGKKSHRIQKSLAVAAEWIAFPPDA